MHARLLLPTALITVAAVACSGRPGGNASNTATTDSSKSGGANGASTGNGNAAMSPGAGPGSASPTGGADTTQPHASAGDVSGGAGSVSDANILAVLHEANQAEIGAARLALTSSNSASVKSFAHQMIRDHTKLDHAGDSVAKATNITPALPANDSLSAHIAQETQQLTAAGKGAGFDKQYIDDQVQDHQTVLALLQQFQTQAQNPKVKAAVTGAMPIVQGHLDRAKRLSATLGSETTQS
jgi:putative membrane protein